MRVSTDLEREGTAGVIRGLLQIVSDNRADGRHFLVVALDLSNAFGSAWSLSVVCMMRAKWLSEELVCMVKRFIRERKVCVEGRE